MRLPSRLTVVTAALLILLPVLAVLQFRWLGQLSRAEAERMQRNLQHAAQQFRESFDGEISRAFTALQVDSAIVRDESWPRYAERYAAWASTTAYPGLIENVYLIDAHASDVRLRRWNAQTRTFDPADWQGPLASSRDHFKNALAAFALRQPLVRETMPFRDGEALLVAPLINVHIGTLDGPQMHQPVVTVFGFTILQLNVPLMRQQILPALAQRHFNDANGSAAYHLSIVDAKNPKRIIYQSSPAAPTERARAAVVQPLLDVHRDPLMFMARGPNRELRATHNLFVSVLREKRGNGVFQTRIATNDEARWRLLAQHERGSLEAAVTGVRQRNLVISFGILLLMTVSVGLLLLSSRRAQQLARQQMEFVAGVSHELRTPVAVIRSAAENLSHGVVGDPDRVRRYGDALQVEARRLGEMVERVLQFAGIESGRPIARVPLAVEQVVDEAVDGALPAGHDFEIERQVAPNLPPVAGDAAMLRSAVQNLITNATKYGGADRWVGVRVDAAANRQDVRITVEDHGGGISATDLPHIFEPFYRGADATMRQIQGSGLGLALVKRIAEAHGGRVTVVTRDSGSAFTLHLPTTMVPESLRLTDLRPPIADRRSRIADGGSPIADGGSPIAN